MKRFILGYIRLVSELVLEYNNFIFVFGFDVNSNILDINSNGEVIEFCFFIGYCDNVEGEFFWLFQVFFILLVCVFLEVFWVFVMVWKFVVVIWVVGKISLDDLSDGVEVVFGGFLYDENFGIIMFVV